jgi:hypothetical protein
MGAEHAFLRFIITFRVVTIPEALKGFPNVALKLNGFAELGYLWI